MVGVPSTANKSVTAVFIAARPICGVSPSDGTWRVRNCPLRHATCNCPLRHEANDLRRRAVVRAVVLKQRAQFVERRERRAAFAALVLVRVKVLAREIAATRRERRRTTTFSESFDASKMREGERERRRE
jgi:hypothetical protein